MKIVIKVRGVSGKTYKSVTKMSKKDIDDNINSLDKMRDKFTNVKALESLILEKNIYFNPENVESITVKLLYPIWLRIIAYVFRSELRK